LYSDSRYYNDEGPRPGYGYRDIIKGENTFAWTHSHVLVAEEVTACREYCAVFNQSYFGKFFVEGPAAQEAMDLICTNDMRKPIGSTVYTLMCNSAGGVMCDLTVTKLAADRFYITAGGGTATHDFDWISKVIEERAFDCTLTDETEQHGVLSIQGPLAHKVLLGLVKEKDEVALENFPFSTCKSLHIQAGGHDHLVRILRLTFVGELGFELHIPNASCAILYDEIMRQGKNYHIVNAGYRAIDSMSIEKGYKHWHEDLRMDDTPLEAGMGWVCKTNTDVDFIGRAALEAQKAAGVERKLICLTLLKPIPLHGREPILCNGEIVGYVRRGDFGHTVGMCIGYGYVSRPGGGKVTNKWLGEQAFTVHTSNRESVKANWQPKCVFDHAGLRIKGEYELYHTTEFDKY